PDVRWSTPRPGRARAVRAAGDVADLGVRAQAPEGRLALCGRVPRRTRRELDRARGHRARGAAAVAAGCGTGVLRRATPGTPPGGGSGARGALTLLAAFACGARGAPAGPGVRPPGAARGAPPA